MRTDEQGLFLLTIVGSLITLLCSAFILLTCGITGLYSKKSARLIIYLTISNLVTGIVLLLPTYRFPFMCQFQGHLLNFVLMSQMILGSLFMHYAYWKIVQNNQFTKVIEVRYLGILIGPSLLLSIPPFFSQDIGNDCWGGTNSPLNNVIGSFGFILPFTIGILINYSLGLGIFYHFKLFPKGFYSDEYSVLIEKFKHLYKFSLVIYGYMFFLALYSTLLILSIEVRFFDFFTMFLLANNGIYTLILFLKTPKIKEKIQKFFKNKDSVLDLLKEDHDNFTSKVSSTEKLDLSD